MRFITNLAIAAVAAASFSTAALAVSEVTFMQSAQLTTSKIVTYTPAAGSSTLSISGTGQNGVLGVGLEWLRPAYAPATKLFMFADMTMTAVSTTPVVNSGTEFAQTGFNGTLAYSWFDPMLGATVNLLTVEFVDATLNIDFGSTPSGSFFNTDPLHTIVYTSDVFDVVGLTEEDFSLAFTAISKTFSIKSGYGDSFIANVAGSFAGEVPEPSTWAMLIAGFGLVGFAARRRRATAFVAN